MISVVALVFFTISLASDASTAHLPFNPRDYLKKVVSCPATNRAENTLVDIELRTSRIYFFSLGGSNPDSEYSQTMSTSTPKPKKR